MDIWLQIWALLKSFFNSPFLNTVVLGATVLAAIAQIKRAKLHHDRQVEESRTLAKRSQTAQLMLKCRKDTVLQQGVRALDEWYSTSGRNIVDLVPIPPVSEDVLINKLKDDRYAIIYLLNHYENVCICIKHGIYCEDMILDAWKTMMISTYDRARTLIDGIRQTQWETALVQFEAGVEKWRRNERLSK